MKKTIIILCLMLFSLFMGTFAQSPSPGGVHGTEAWFMTESVTDSLNGQYHWADYSGDSVKLMVKKSSLLSEFRQSRSNLKTFNFNPAIRVKHNDLFKHFKLTNSNLSQFTFIGVYAPYQENNSGVVYSVNSATCSTTVLRGESISHNDSVINYSNNAVGNLNLLNSDSPERKEGALKIISHYHAEQPNKSVWGNSKPAIISIGEADTISLNNEETILSSENTYQGYFPELAVYSRNLTPFERNRVESYFAMKYGISLNHSYYRSDSSMIWNISENPDYNHRITTTINDVNSNLYQPISTTSYEETPYYSWLYGDSLDSYHLNNSASAPTKNRLLVQGREFANRINNGKYYIWGDNDQSIELDDSSLMIARNWLLQTNFPDEKPTEVQNVWTGNGVSVYNKGFKNYLIQDLTETVTAVTEKFINGDGAISFSTNQIKGIFDVGFISDKSKVQCDFGFRFTPLGIINFVVDGVAQRTINYGTSIHFSNIKIIKKSSNITLQVNGIGIFSFNINSQSDEYFGLVSMQYNSTNGLYSIDEIRVDGVYDNGNQVELGYIKENNQFYDYKDNAYLIIDRSASGEFLEEDLEYYKVTNYSAQRDKLIFNNIYWDTDGNGADIFSFGCVDCVQADVSTTNATMGDTASNFDGAIDIKIKAGMPAYYYKLKQVNTTDSILGHFSSDSVSIPNLQSGQYILDVGQMGGFEIYGTASANGHKRIAKSNNTITGGEFSWIVPEYNETSVFDVGFGTNQSVSYGYRIQNNTLYFISSGNIIEYGHIPQGTLLSAVYTNDFIIYSIENQQITRAYSVSGSFYGIIEAISGDCQVMNFRFSDMSYMTTTAGMYADFYSPCKVTKSIEILNSDGNMRTFQSRSNISTKSKANTTDIEQNELGLSEFVVYSPNNNSEFTAILTQDVLIPASLVVFDAAGKLVLSREFSGSSNQRKLSFSVPASGVYIVKAITNTQEFTQKIISK